MRFLKIVLLLAAICCLVTPGSVISSDKPGTRIDADSLPDFHLLWKRVEQADSTVDFTQVRMAYTRTSDYDPYDGTSQDLRSEMDAAFNNNDFSTAIDLAKKLVKRDPMQTDAYIVLDVSYEQTGDTAKSRFHHFVANGLIQSVLASGSGRTRENAFTVISTDEEYIVLNYLGVKLIQQALVEEAKHSYDVMTVKDPDADSSYELYFNIDLPMRALNRQFKDKD